jgi:hypothetical protein
MEKVTWMLPIVVILKKLYYTYTLNLPTYGVHTYLSTMYIYTYLFIRYICPTYLPTYLFTRYIHTYIPTYPLAT